MWFCGILLVRAKKKKRPFQIYIYMYGLTFYTGSDLYPEIYYSFISFRWRLGCRFIHRHSRLLESSHVGTERDGEKWNLKSQLIEAAFVSKYTFSPENAILHMAMFYYSQSLFRTVLIRMDFSYYCIVNNTSPPNNTVPISVTIVHRCE